MARHRRGPQPYGRWTFSVAGPMALNPLSDFIQRAAETVLCVYSKRTCSRDSSASNAFGVLNDYALHKSTHLLLTLSLTTVLSIFTTQLNCADCDMEIG